MGRFSKLEGRIERLERTGVESSERRARSHTLSPEQALAIKVELLGCSPESLGHAGPYVPRFTLDQRQAFMRRCLFGEQP